MILASDVVDKAREWKGVPYVRDGRSREGTCCVGLMVCILRELGEDPPDELGLGMYEDAFERMCRAIERGCDLIARDDRGGLGVEHAQPADVLVFHRRLMPNHAGIYVGGGSMVHSDEGVGRVCEVDVDDRWRKRLVRIYRYREVSVG